jgi:small-conductance mechanosensitive channel
MDLAKWMNGVMVHIGVPVKFANMFDETVITVLVVVAAIGLDVLFRWGIVGGLKRYVVRERHFWASLLLDSGAVGNLLHIVPGVAIYLTLPYMFLQGKRIMEIGGKICVLYIIVMVLLSLNSFISILLDIYKKRASYKNMPLKGVIEMSRVVVFFIGGLIFLAVLLGKSPTTLIAGLGASAAILMLVFKDMILGFVSSVQLSTYDMLRPGDMIQLGEIFGTVEEVTLITVKIRNRDNTISTIPPYSLVSGSFRNWRGMLESAGRRVDKTIVLDVNTVRFCSEEMLSTYRRTIPLLADYQPAAGTVPTNSQLFRVYIDRYLHTVEAVNTELNIIISQEQMTAYGLPIQVYFFSRIKAWRDYDRFQSDIFDHLLAMVPRFDLRLYQYDGCARRGDAP